MSRCFPFPPPGYMRNGACGEALIESIKLQREGEKAKKDRKQEKRREKKEKKREKKEKRKERKEKDGTASHASNGKEFKLIDLKKVRADEGSGCLQKEGDYENEQFERSDITEEHDQPVSSRELCCLSDTQSSKKRKRSTSPFSQEHGTVLKIRLPLRKHREPEQSKLEDQLGSTSRSIGTADSFDQDTNGSDHQLQRVPNAETYQCPGNSDCEELQSLVHEAAPITNLLDDKSRSVLSVYNSLFQYWVPPPLAYEGFESEDQDWLFSSKLQERPVPKKVRTVPDAFRCSSPSLWPRAQYLPEVELYALPYTVPF